MRLIIIVMHLEGFMAMHRFTAKFCIFAMFVILVSCEADAPVNPVNQEYFQVYDDNGAEYQESVNLKGVPRISNSISALPLMPEPVFDPGGGSFAGDANAPSIGGSISNGKIAIDFKKQSLELPPEFANSFTGDVKIAYIRLESAISDNIKFSLNKQNAINSHRVHIYYSSADFDRPLNKIALKKGWNFIEEYANPDWAYGNGEPYFITGFTTQDINAVYGSGYRWHLEL